MSHPDDMEICDAKITGTADYSQPFNVRLRTANGEYTWFEEFATPIYENGEFVALHGLYRENNATMLLKQQVEQAQSEDLLTGTKNRLYFEDQLAIYDSKLDTSIGLIICNIDFIKQTNVKNGFESGNKLIVQLATLLLHASKEKAFVCRTNGDEFTIIYPNCSENEFIQLMNEIRQQIAVYNRTNKALKLNVSIGGYYSLSSVGQIPTLLMHAERKMQAEKEHHKLFAQTIKNA
jgi:diguanylate cyclase (GGDEF)-like protein